MQDANDDWLEVFVAVRNNIYEDFDKGRITPTMLAIVNEFIKQAEYEYGLEEENSLVDAYNTIFEYAERQEDEYEDDEWEDEELEDEYEEDEWEDEELEDEE